MNDLNFNMNVMSSMEIAELTGKRHADILESIRNMESAWEKITGRKFSLKLRINDLGNGRTKENPYYELTKTETLYVATKFKDESRAKLVLRWEELENNRVANGNADNYELSKEDVASLKMLARMVRMMNMQPFFPPSSPETVSPEYVSYKRMNSNRNAELDASVEHLIGNENLSHSYYTVYAFARHNFIELDKYEAARLGNLSANLCRRNGFAIGKCADARFGTINVYPREILSAVFRQRYPEHHINL